MIAPPRWLVASLCVLGAATPLHAHACGPDLIQPRLSWVGDELLDVPRSTFRADVMALATSAPPPPGAAPRRVRTCEGVRADLSEVLGETAEAQAIVERWVQIRCHERSVVPDALAAAVPQEFALYAQGVAALHQARYPDAADTFRQLLALPGPQRRHRSTWATYMLARLAVDGMIGDDPLPLWASVRDLAAEGYADTLGLGLASLRHEAHVHADQDRPDRAIASLLAYLSGGGTLYGPDTIAQHVRVLLASERSLQVRATRDPRIAEVVAAWLTSRAGSRQLPAGWIGGWLEAAQHAGQAAGADRLAWAAYRQGRFQDAGSWARLADPSSAMGHWIRAKLALREGDLQHAIASLQRAEALFDDHAAALSRPDTTCSHGHSGATAVSTELGVVLVAADRYEEALTAFLSAGDWPDAAWTAERLLTADELVGYVELWYPDHPGLHLPPGDWPAVDRSELGAALRHLLARRLAREGRWHEAVPYFPHEVWEHARIVQDTIDRGRDPAQADLVRGGSLWRAALEIRRHGWALLATEMEPDFRIEAGSFQLHDTTAARSGAQPGSAPALLPASPEELGRLARHDPKEPRYHYLYTAWALADEAVALLPDGSDALAVAACTSGNWMRDHDIMRSSQMWLVLLRRAYRTEIGRSTDRARGRWWGLDEEGLCAPLPPDPPTPATPSCGGQPSALAWILPLVLWRRRER